MKNNYIAGSFNIGATVGNPNLNPVDNDATCHNGQIFQRSIVIVLKILCQEKVSVLVVIISRYLKLIELLTALQHGFGALAFILAKHGFNRSFTKLHGGAETK